MAARTAPAQMRPAGPILMKEVNHYIGGEPVTFFLIVAGIEWGALAVIGTGNIGATLARH